jgi:hypothetical protein
VPTGRLPAAAPGRFPEPGQASRARGAGARRKGQASFFRKNAACPSRWGAKAASSERCARRPPELGGGTRERRTGRRRIAKRFRTTSRKLRALLTRNSVRPKERWMPAPSGGTATCSDLSAGGTASTSRAGRRSGSMETRHDGLLAVSVEVQRRGLLAHREEGRQARVRTRADPLVRTQERRKLPLPPRR